MVNFLDDGLQEELSLLLLSKKCKLRMITALKINLETPEKE